MQETRTLNEEGELSLWMGTEALALAIVVGDMHICFKRFRILVINDCNYVLDFKINLISVSYLYKDYY